MIDYDWSVSRDCDCSLRLREPIAADAQMFRRDRDDSRTTARVCARAYKYYAYICIYAFKCMYMYVFACMQRSDKNRCVVVFNKFLACIYVQLRASSRGTREVGGERRGGKGGAGGFDISRARARARAAVTFGVHVIRFIES